MRIRDWSSDVCSTDLDLLYVEGLEQFGSYARGVILLSDIDGLYDSNPHTNPDATLIPVVETIDGGIEAMADRKSSSGMGSGGMVSKIEAARIATAAGIDLAIISGHGPHALARFTHTGHGTVFVEIGREHV